MNGRVLAVWGAEDLNADARRNACRYPSLLKDNPKAKAIAFPQAGHGLLQAPAYNYQLSSDWPVLRQWQFLYAGREAYHPGALSLITDWIKKQNPGFDNVLSGVSVLNHLLITGIAAFRRFVILPVQRCGHAL